MLTLTFSGLLSILVAITMLVLVWVIFIKEPPETADYIDRILLLLCITCLAASLAFSGVLVMAGALSGFATAEFTVELLINNSLKMGVVIFGWIKIIRSYWQLRKRR